MAKADFDPLVVSAAGARIDRLDELLNDSAQRSRSKATCFPTIGRTSCSLEKQSSRCVELMNIVSFILDSQPGSIL